MIVSRIEEHHRYSEMPPAKPMPAYGDFYLLPDHPPRPRQRRNRTEDRGARAPALVDREARSTSLEQSRTPRRVWLSEGTKPRRAARAAASRRVQRTGVISSGIACHELRR